VSPFGRLISCDDCGDTPDELFVIGEAPSTATLCRECWEQATRDLADKIASYRKARLN
jgi:hypothetical protein